MLLSTSGFDHHAKVFAINKPRVTANDMDEDGVMALDATLISVPKYIIMNSLWIRVAKVELLILDQTLA